jgi:hypothetical protein
MELAIAGAVAILGWQFSQRGRQDPQPYHAPISPEVMGVQDKIGSGGRDIELPRPGSYPIGPPPVTSTELLKRHDELSEKRWQAAHDPRASGIVGPRSVPFFSSYRKQHTNDAIKQQRMEIHTGNLTAGASQTGTWKSKVETPSMFKPVAQQVTSSGSSGNSLNYGAQRQAASVSGKQNNTLPFTQQRVGPGIGVGTKVAAVDGFHSQYRSIPPDAYGYKRNELEGRSLTGAAISARAVDPVSYVKGVPRIYDMARRPLEKGRATVTALAQRPAFSKLRPLPAPKVMGCRVDGEDYYGIAGAGGHNLTAGASSRSKYDTRPSLPMTNVTGARVAVGGYTGSTFDAARFTSQQREHAQGTDVGMLTGDHMRHRSSGTYDVASTNRDIATRRDHTGGAGHYVATGTTRHAHTPLTTLRELSHDKSPGPGAVAPIITGQSVQCTDRQLLKEAKRGSYVVSTYVTAPERTNEFRRANIGDELLSQDRAYQGRVATRSDANANQIAAHAASSSMYVNNGNPGTSTTDGRNKLPSVNPYQDYGIAKAVLKGNEYAVSIN